MIRSGKGFVKKVKKASIKAGSDLKNIWKADSCLYRSFKVRYARMIAYQIKMQYGNYMMNWKDYLLNTISDMT